MRSRPTRIRSRHFDIRSRPTEIQSRHVLRAGPDIVTLTVHATPRDPTWPLVTSSVPHVPSNVTLGVPMPLRCSVLASRMVLCDCYAVSGTDMGYGTTRLLHDV
eukprot:2648184-Rhodomonas_salina.1